MIFVNQTWWDRHIAAAPKIYTDLHKPSAIQHSQILPAEPEWVMLVKSMSDGFWSFPLTAKEAIDHGANLAAMLNLTFAKRIPDADVQWPAEMRTKPWPEGPWPGEKRKGKRG